MTKKIDAIIRMPEHVGTRTVDPNNCRHVEVCEGRLVIFWAYDNAQDIVRFRAFKTHKDAFGYR